MGCVGSVGCLWCLKYYISKREREREREVHIYALLSGRWHHTMGICIVKQEILTCTYVHNILCFKVLSQVAGTYMYTYTSSVGFDDVHAHIHVCNFESRSLGPALAHNNIL